MNTCSLTNLIHSSYLGIIILSFHHLLYPNDSDSTSSHNQNQSTLPLPPILIHQLSLNQLLLHQFPHILTLFIQILIFTLTLTHQTIPLIHQTTPLTLFLPFHLKDLSDKGEHHYTCLTMYVIIHLHFPQKQSLQVQNILYPLFTH
jgi:hypothetical protein